MADVKNSVWVGELERFGYNLVVVGRTEKEVRDALIKAYKKTYADLNDGADPTKEYPYGDERSYLDYAVDEMYIREMLFGRVEWC